MRFLVVVMVLVFSIISNAQNQLPLVWNLELENQPNVKHNANLLLSWERQGFSHLSGKGKLTNEFSVSDENVSHYVLEISLRVDIHKISINGHLIGGELKNHFIWAANPDYPVHKFDISKDLLNSDKKNIIEIECSNFSYTGGISRNHAILYSIGNKKNSSIELKFVNESHLYENANDIKFKINTKTENGGSALLTIRNDYSDTIYVKNVDVPKGEYSSIVNLSKENIPAGFYEVTAVLNNGSYSGNAQWFTVEPTYIAKAPKAPEGFYNYWNELKSDLAKVTPNFKVEKVDSLCTENRNGYIVEMQSLGNVSIKGYYFVPKKKGVHPAILNVPGYGYGFEYLDEFLNVKDDVIELAICVRGHGISKDAMDPGIPGFWGYEICDKNKSAYRGIFMDCLRAVDFFLSRNEVDKNKIGVVGGSQGGGLTIMTAGLAADRISAASYFDPFPCDIVNNLKIRTMIKTEIQNFIDFYDNQCSFEDVMANYEFIDTKYFAKLIKAETLYVTGLFDDDCAPRGGFTAFNEILSKKDFIIFPNDSHIMESGFKAKAMEFFKNKFGY